MYIIQSYVPWEKTPEDLFEKETQINSWAANWSRDCKLDV